MKKIFEGFVKVNNKTGKASGIWDDDIGDVAPVLRGEIGEQDGYSAHRVVLIDLDSAESGDDLLDDLRNYEREAQNDTDTNL